MADPREWPPITVVIPTIPSRWEMLYRATESVRSQDYPGQMHIQLELDTKGEGAAAVRHRGLLHSRTRWTAFLDDDDWLYPYHLSRLMRCALERDADLVYPWFDVVGGTDPFPSFFGKPWDDSEPHQTTVTFLARTQAMLHCDGFDDKHLRWGLNPDDPVEDWHGHRAGEEYRLVLRMVEKGYKIVHLPERSWAWVHHSNNTSGLPERVAT